MKSHLVLKSMALLFLITQSLLAWPQEGPASKPVRPVLDNNIILNLFSQRVNEAKTDYKLSDIKFELGEFTNAGFIDAIVSFSDENQPHATGYYEVWWLSYENGWKIKKKLFDWDVGNFKIVDIGDQGRPKIWIEGNGGNQGYFKFAGKLISLSNGHEDTLFLTKGYNNTGAYGESDVFNILFKDIDGDGLVEIVETRIKEKYDRVKQENIITSKSEYIYKFNGKRYIGIK